MLMNSVAPNLVVYSQVPGNNKKLSSYTDQHILLRSDILKYRNVDSCESRVSYMLRGEDSNVSKNIALDSLVGR